MYSSMLHGSETWPVKKVALLQEEIRMVSWMCSVKVIEFQVKS